MDAENHGNDPDHDPEPVSSPARPLSPLPALSARPALYSGCCLALSEPLIVHLHSLLRPSSPKLVLSIGSGFGLLEAILLVEPYSLNIVGVEVQPSPNRYLPLSNHRTVSGTRFLDPLAAEAATWLFVYPRRAGLVDEYMAKFGEGAVEKIVWIGPQADWDDYKDCFEGSWDVEVKGANEFGGRAWEAICVADKKSGSVN